MTDLRPGVRALRLPHPNFPHPNDGKECFIRSFPYFGWVEMPNGEVLGGRICNISDDNAYGARFTFLLLPLWDSDEDQTVEHEKEVTA